MKKYLLFLILLVFTSTRAENVEYTKDIFSSAFISFNDEDFRNIFLEEKIDNLDVNNSLLFIYTPGSMNDDRMDGVCSTYN